MCESYREVFYEIIKIYDELRKAHPKEAIKTGDLTVEKGDALVGGRFYTKKGLTLMGATALKGNVYLETNGKGAKQAEGIDSINRFVFFGLFTLKVNGTECDPIFHSIGKDNLGELLSSNYESDKVKMIVDTSKLVGTEFGASFIMVNDKPAYQKTVSSIAAFYANNTKKIDKMLTKKKPKIKAKIVKECRALLQGSIDDFDTFKTLVFVDIHVTRAQLTAFKKVWNCSFLRTPLA